MPPARGRSCSLVQALDVGVRDGFVARRGDAVIRLGEHEIALNELRRGVDGSIRGLDRLESDLHPMISAVGPVDLGALLRRQGLAPRKRRVSELRLVPPVAGWWLPRVVLAYPARELLEVVYGRILLLYRGKPRSITSVGSCFFTKRAWVGEGGLSSAPWEFVWAADEVAPADAAPPAGAEILFVSCSQLEKTLSAAAKVGSSRFAGVPVLDRDLRADLPKDPDSGTVFLRRPLLSRLEEKKK